MNYDVIFDGKIAEGKNIEEVKKKLALLFKKDVTEIEKLFSGKPVAVKRNVDFEVASKYWEAFEKAGAVCRMEPIKEETDEEDEEAEARKIWY